MSNRKNLDLEKFPENRVSKRMISRVSPIYERSYVAKWLYEVMGQEVDDAEIRFSELREQANPETATWGLCYWEQRYGIEVDESRSLAARRAAVVSKRGTRAPMNPARIEEILSSMSGRKIRVEENVAPYTFRVYVENGEGFVDYDAIVRKLKKVKPSHLTFEVCFEVFATAYIGASYHGTAQRVAAKITGTLRPRELLSITYAKAGLLAVQQQEAARISGTLHPKDHKAVTYAKAGCAAYRMQMAARIKGDIRPADHTAN
jgi:hypothetical protein